MSVLPVVTRELYVAGRRPFTYKARFTTAALGFGAALFVFFLSSVSKDKHGMVLLALALTLMFSLSVGLAVSAACRESRQASLTTLIGILILAGLPMMAGVLHAELTSGSGRPTVHLWVCKLSPVFTLMTAFSAGAGLAAMYWQSAAIVALESLILLGVGIFTFSALLSGFLGRRARRLLSSQFRLQASGEA